ncbi:hypothetical protein CB1_000940019 [Camelus ferus]|nr:hypothetical protein CB1_000940019 [Camelus ferus]
MTDQLRSATAYSRKEGGFQEMDSCVVGDGGKQQGTSEEQPGKNQRNWVAKGLDNGEKSSWKHGGQGRRNGRFTEESEHPVGVVIAILIAVILIIIMMLWAGLPP